MPQIPILSNVWNALTAPNWPRTAFSISETHLALTSLRRSGSEFEPRNLGVMHLPQGLVRASFSEPNITNEASLIEKANETLTLAAVRRVRRVTVGLPAASTRSQVIVLDSVPDARAELAQMLEWKIERSFGAKYADLRVSSQRLADFHGRSQWLVTAVQEKVVSQYERIFKELGWQAGLVLPQHLGEAQWLLRAGIAEDQALVSFHSNGFACVIVRGAEPIFIREVACTPEEREDEFYRLVVYYRDRLLPENAPATLSRLLTLGNAQEQHRFREVLASALESFAVALEPPQLGLRVEPSAPFKDFAAAAGLATLAWGN